MPWYKKATDLGIGSHRNTYDALGTGSETWLDNEKGQKKMIYYPAGSTHPLNKGDRVKNRHFGIMGSNTKEGKVISKDKNIIKVKWDDSGETEEFDLNDVTTMATIESIR